MRMTKEMKINLDASVDEISDLINGEQEFEAMVRAKAVCDILKELDPGSEVQAVAEHLVQVADSFLNDVRVVA